ncbi:hypothetical protein [Variovorax boronicumulans]|uniref:hypothetical protein n=1 Tax=Variovorax boronicumulans TaxID=436515 RepID=UPI0033935D24
MARITGAAAFEPAHRWLAERRPDVRFFICNDHLRSLLFDHSSTLSLGMAEPHAVPGKNAAPQTWDAQSPSFSKQ